MNDISIKHVFDHVEVKLNLWNTVVDEHYITSKQLRISANPRFYSILYNILPASLELRKVNSHYQFYKTGEPFMLFLPKKATVHFRVHPNAPIRMVEIMLSEKYFGKENPEMELRQCPPTALHLLEKLFTLCLDETPEIQQIIKLNDEILRICISDMATPLQHKAKSIHCDTMLELKSLIENAVGAQLPQLTDLAKQFSMGVSTMKRQFKLNFGVNIYQYYLQKKMEMAVELLHEEKHTVNEIAERLGYASVSNFIETFKKYYGSSPGSYKRFLLTETVKAS